MDYTAIDEAMEHRGTFGERERERGRERQRRRDESVWGVCEKQEAIRQGKGGTKMLK